MFALRRAFGLRRTTVLNTGGVSWTISRILMVPSSMSASAAMENSSDMKMAKVENMSSPLGTS